MARSNTFYFKIFRSISSQLQYLWWGKESKHVFNIYLYTILSNVQSKVKVQWSIEQKQFSMAGREWFFQEIWGHWKRSVMEDGRVCAKRLKAGKLLRAKSGIYHHYRTEIARFLIYFR